MHETPESVANTLQSDLGITKGIQYAEKISEYAGFGMDPDGQRMHKLYRAAAEILTARSAEPPTAPRSLEKLAEEALQIQNACNMSGIARGFVRAIDDLRVHIGGSTDPMRRHSIIRLWASKIHDLAGMGVSDSEAFGAAYDDCLLLQLGAHPIMQPEHQCDECGAVFATDDGAAESKAQCDGHEKSCSLHPDNEEKTADASN